MRLGIIDVGTNSIHLVIGILGFDERFHVLLKERDLTRLGEGGLAQNRLTKTSMNRAISVLARYAATLKRCQVDHVEAVATSAVREARNGREFVHRVQTKLELPLRIITGREEARLIYLGVLQTHRFHRPSLLVTIGGGSAQVVQGDGVHLRYAVSLPLGGARLAQQFIHHDPPYPEEIEALQAYVQHRWAPVARALARRRWHHAFGSSATIYQLMLAANRSSRPPQHKHRLSISRRSLADLVHWCSGSTAAERMELPGIDPRREDLLLPTAVALLGWMKACKVSTLRHASGSLREGLVLQYLMRQRRRSHQTSRVASVTPWEGHGVTRWPAAVQRHALKHLTRKRRSLRSAL